jgi:cytochrome c-type biogenesis protein CcmE
LIRLAAFLVMARGFDHREVALMSVPGRRYVGFGAVIAVILLALGYLAYTGVQDSKSYYVTIKELNGMGNEAYSKRLRVAGNVAPGSIKRQGTHLEFLLVEQDRTLPVVYSGTEAPPDTFKDNAQALAEGKFGRDGVFHATNIQAKCASKYAPKQPGQPGAAPAAEGNAQKAALTGAQAGER